MPYDYRIAAGPPLGLTPSFLSSFALNLQNPDRGPYVPVPVDSPREGEWGFEGRPFRNSLEIFAQTASDLAGRLPAPDYDRPLSGFLPSEDGLRWHLTHSRCEPSSELFSFTFQRKGRGRRAPLGSLVEVFSYRGTSSVSVSVAEHPSSCLTQESQWRRDVDGNMDLLRATFFSKKGPPDWGDLPVPFFEVLSLLSLALYETRGDDFIRAQADRHRGWVNASSEFRDPAALAAWLVPALQNRESSSVRTLRQIGFIDRHGLQPREPVLYARWFRPWKRSDWYLEINYRQRPGEASVPMAIKTLFWKAAGGSSY